jgi:hypothetical protein
LYDQHANYACRDAENSLMLCCAPLLRDAKAELMRKLLLELNYFVDAGLQSRCPAAAKAANCRCHKAAADAAGSHIKKPPDA